MRVCETVCVLSRPRLAVGSRHRIVWRARAAARASVVGRGSCPCALFACGVVCDGVGGGSVGIEESAAWGGFAFSMGGPVCVCCGSCVNVRPLQAQPRVRVCMGHDDMMASVGASFGLDLQGRASVFGQKRGEQCWRPVGGERDSSSRRSAPRQLHVSRGFGD